MLFSTASTASKQSFRKDITMAKTARSKEEPASALDPSVEAARKEPTQEEIALRAYHIYLEREGAGGDPLEDWLQAERELTEAR
jgi:hypothetical protein